MARMAPNPLGSLGSLGPLGPLGRLGPLGPLGPEACRVGATLVHGLV